jgi:hypothetical protein
MFIGFNFFAQHVVCIDFPGHRFLIRKERLSFTSGTGAGV